MQKDQSTVSKKKTCGKKKKNRQIFILYVWLHFSFPSSRQYVCRIFMTNRHTRVFFLFLSLFFSSCENIICSAQPAPLCPPSLSPFREEERTEAFVGVLSRPASFCVYCQRNTGEHRKGFGCLIVGLRSLNTWSSYSTGVFILIPRFHRHPSSVTVTLIPFIVRTDLNLLYIIGTLKGLSITVIIPPLHIDRDVIS